MNVRNVEVGFAQQGRRIENVAAGFYRSRALHADPQINLAGGGDVVPVRKDLALAVRVANDHVV